MFCSRHQLAFVAAVLTVVAQCVDAAPPNFQNAIRPILTQKCGKCHASDNRKGELDLSNLPGIRKGGESGEPVVGRTLDDSLLWALVESGDMPPDGEEPLDSDERRLIRNWIESGTAAVELADTSTDAVTEHDIMPIVLLRCVACHGATLRRAGVDLRTPSLMRVGGKNGPALIPGDPDASLMIRRVESGACPPQKQLLRYFVKRPSQNEIGTLRQWIADGAAESDILPDVATHEPDPLVSSEDRQHWAFQPPVRLPGAHSIDSFIGDELQRHGLTFAEEADRDTLIRRVCLDLTGLPPDSADRERWRADPDPDWYTRIVDELLASPHYGERWGRRWLDIAGYADSEGGVATDPLRAVAWKYRDYVIRSLNNDKPYDQFLLEQIAGDELIDHAAADVITDEMVKNLTATGFLRMGIDQTGSRTMNFVPERLGVIADVIGVLGSGVMGLTLECARCHSHKYDPIPHRDYYRFKAIFQGALDEHDWLSFRNRTLKVDTPERLEEIKRINPPLESKIKRLKTSLAASRREAQLTVLRSHYPEQSDADRKATIQALRIADNVRTLPQRILVEKLQTAELLPDEEQPASVMEARQAVTTIQQQIRSVQRQLIPPATIRALWDQGRPSPTYILRRGEHDKPGRSVGPGVPSVLTDGRSPFLVTPPFPNGTLKTGRRLAFARWLTQPEHPLTSRVIVNRIWHHHFGTGIVASLENFGAKGERPSHPELLDWLAVRFMDSGWSLKSLHREIVTSRAWRQTSQVSEEAQRLDPDNRLVSRMALRRMDAETLRDSLLFIAGRLNTAAGGPPDAVSVDRNGLVSAIPTPNGQWRRSIYAQYRRTEIPSLLATFDYPEMGPNCVNRSVSTISPQALMLWNNQHVRELAGAVAHRVEADTGDHVGQIDALYAIVLHRLPTVQEQSAGTAALAELTAAWSGDRGAALESFCHTMLNSAAFLYID